VVVAATSVEGLLRQPAKYSPPPQVRPGQHVLDRWYHKSSLQSKALQLLELPEPLDGKSLCSISLVSPELFGMDANEPWCRSVRWFRADYLPEEEK
jgi:hypothetical protein